MPRALTRALFLLLAITMAGGTLGLAAPKPLPPLSPEELELRRIAQPLCDGITEGPELEPLRAWLDARHAAGQGRNAERELRRLLKRMHEENNRDFLRAAQWVHRLQVHRKRLFTDLTERKSAFERVREDYQASPAVPQLEELLPGIEGIPDAFLLETDPVLDQLPAEAGEQRPAERGAPEPELAPVVDTDMDEARLLNRLTLDQTMLGHLLHECDNGYEEERERHRTALAALEAFLSAYQPPRRES
jgi:hypothetical protein